MTVIVSLKSQKDCLDLYKYLRYEHINGIYIESLDAFCSVRLRFNCNFKDIVFPLYKCMYIYEYDFPLFNYLFSKRFRYIQPIENRTDCIPFEGSEF